MLILSNSLTQEADEGSLKLATSIVKRIKKENEKTHIISFERTFSHSDEHLKLNKFHISAKLVSLIRKSKQSLMYIPFPAPTLSMALRIFILSIFARYGFKVMMIRQYPINRIAEILLRCSRAELIVFSKQAEEFYQKIVTKNRVTYLKTGIDTNKFLPVSPEKSRELKIKYDFDPDRPIVLHVGHMKEGRNVAELMKIDEKYHVLLVVSTLSKERQNSELREKLLSCPNIRIMENYIPDIEEIYQMCDVYFFPVRQIGHCIDVPLSCLEAAACNKPVITTNYGEMKELISHKGFYLLNDFSKETINEIVSQSLEDEDYNTRSVVLEYDYQNAIKYFN